MHVGVKETVAQGVAQKALGHDARQVFQIEALRFERGMVRQMRAVDPFERQNVLRGAIPVDRRHTKSRIALCVLRHLGQRRGFEPKIHFERDRAAQGRYRLDQPEPAGFRGKFLRIARGEREGVLVDREAPFDARPQHLDRDRAHPVFTLDPGAVNLRDRGGRDRGAKRRVCLGDRLPECLFNNRDRFRMREWRHAVLQTLKLPRNRSANNIRPGRQKLPELHIGRTELRQRSSQTPGLAILARPLDQLCRAQSEPRRQWHQCRIQVAKNALAREHIAGAHQAQRIGESGDHACGRARQACVTAANRNGARRRRRSSGCTRPARILRLESSRRKPAASGIYGSIPPGSGTIRRRLRPPCRAPGSH